MPAEEDLATPRVKSLDLKRRQTDVSYLILFVIFFIAWIGAVLYAMSTGRTQKLFTTVRPKIATRTDLQEFLIRLTSILTLVLTLIMTYFLHLKKVLCTASSVRIIEIVLLALSICDVTDRLKIYEIVYIYVTATLFVCFNNLSYYYSYDRYCHRFLAIPGTSKLLFCACALAFSFVFLTIAAIHFTSPSDFLRLFIIFGCFCTLNFILNFLKMTFALIITTYQQSSRPEDVTNSSILQYIKPVFRYHLGSIALSAFSLVSAFQTLIVLIRTKHQHKSFYEILYRTYSVFDLPSYALISTAKYGHGMYIATVESCETLIQHCSSSRNSLNRLLDLTIKLTLLVGFSINFIFLPTLEVSQISTLEWLGYGFVFYLMHLHSTIQMLYRTREYTSRLFILQEMQEDMMTDTEYNLSRDLCYCEARRSQRQGDYVIDSIVAEGAFQEAQV